MISQTYFTADRAKTTLSMVFVFVSLSFIFITDLAVNWGYMGFEYQFSEVKLFLSIASLFLLVIFMYSNMTVRNFFFVFIIYAYIIPFLVMFSFGGAFYTSFFIVLVAFLSVWLAQLAKLKRLQVPKLTRGGLLLLCLSLTTGTVMILVAFGAYQRFNLNILRVYEFRRDAAADLPSIFGYITSPVAKVIIPLGIVLGGYYRSKLTVLVFILLTVIYFGLTHHKSVLAAPLLIALIYFVLQRVKTIFFVHWFFCSISVIGIIENLWVRFVAIGYDFPFFTSFVVRRVLFIPPLLDQYYVEFFSLGDFMYWANSRISFGAVTTEYDLSAPFLIGEEFFSNSEMSANSGFIGSGFSNAGLLGVVIYGVVIGLFISVLASYGKFLGNPIVICASFAVLIGALTTSDLITSILTHGLLFLLILLSVMPNRRENNLEKK